MGGEAPQPGRLSRALSLDGSGVPEEALHLVLGYVDDPRDREAASLACRRWHRIDALTRKHVTVHFCYAVSPSRLLTRFPRLESHGARTKSKRARTSSSAVDTPQKLAKASLFADQAATTPEKVSAQKPGPLSPSAAATGLTWTPEKTEERRRPLLRRASGKGAVALSVKEVRRAALELQRTDKGHTAEVEKEDALESVARELGVGAGAGRSPVKRRPEVKLPQRTRPFHYLLMHGDKDAAGRLLSCWSASLPARHSRPEVLRLMS